MFNVFGKIDALEELSTGTYSGENLSDILITMIGDDAETAQHSIELDEMTELYHSASAAVEEMEVLAASIEEFGISAAVMKTVDPNQVLVSKGIVVDYDTLELTPVKDANATAALEGFVDSLKRMWKRLVAFFKKIGAKIAELFRAAFRGLKAHEAAIIAMIEKLESASIDESKFGDAKVNTYSVTDIDKIYQGLALLDTGIVKEILDASKKIGVMVAGTPDKTIIESEKKVVETALKSIENNSDLSAIGLDVKTKDGEVVSITTKKPTINKNNADLKSHKYSSVAIIVTKLKETYKAIVTIKKSQRNIEFLGKEYAEASKVISKASSVVDGESSSVAKIRADGVKAIQSNLGWAKQVAQFAFTCESRLVSECLKVGKAALSAKSDK